jgi:hypothetical protein
MSDAAADLQSAILLVSIANWRSMATTNKAWLAVFETNSQRAHAVIDTLAWNADFVAFMHPVQTDLEA